MPELRRTDVLLSALSNTEVADGLRMLAVDFYKRGLTDPVVMVAFELLNEAARRVEGE